MRLTAARVAAVAIALLAVADPAITSARSSRPLVAIITSDHSGDAELSNRAERELSRDFTVVRGWVGSAAGVVLVGNALPDDPTSLTVPLIAVMPTRRTPSLRIAALEAPAAGPLNARIPVRVSTTVIGGRGRRIDVELQRDGIVVDQKRQVVTSDTARIELTLTYVPTVAGASSLGARAVISGTTAADEASAIVDARDERLGVLFFDLRASWASTFVRRALERDPRFVVTHRVLTSRGLSNTGGDAPTSLRDAEALGAYQTVVVGAPEQLTEADVAGIETFMRSRGGRVVLLMDRRVAAPIDRLTAAGSWRASRLPAAVGLDDRTGNGVLKAQEIAWPVATPNGATILTTAVGRDSSPRAVIWSAPVGAGRVLVSGALDAWEYRDPGTSGFDAFWANQIAELSASAPGAVEIDLSENVLGPGEAADIRVTVRDAMLTNVANRSATVGALLVGGDDSTAVRLWPDARPGVFTGTITAPRRSGTYTLIASSGAKHTEARFVVDSLARAPTRDEPHVVEAFLSSRGGAVLAEADLRDLSARVSAALQPVSRVETWHPMRSAWWMVPFALLLGAEWWWRRRRGQA